MKKLLYILILLPILVSGQDSTITTTIKKGFLGLYGKGADLITGGRGGKKFFITSSANTETSTYVPASEGVDEHYTGTFRGAMNMTIPLHIIPRISAKTTLTNWLLISGTSKGNKTYHGHLAPVGGFSITGDWILYQDSENVILRYLRSRFGNTSIAGTDDAFTWRRGSMMAVDHCSFGWAADESMSMGAEAAADYHSIIFQNNIVGQCKDGHNTGSILGYTDSGTGGNADADYHNNLVIGVTHRTPNASGDDGSEIRIYNNVVYDWEFRLTNVVNAPNVDVAYNYYKEGPNSGTIGLNERNVRQSTGFPRSPSIFTEGNYYPGVLTDPDADNQTIWSVFGSSTPLAGSLFRDTRLTIATEVGYTPTTATAAYTKMITNEDVGMNRTVDSSGNTVIGHDSVDAGYISAVQAGTNPRTAEGSWSHPSVTSNTFYTDTNWNAIYDGFETAHSISSASDVPTNIILDGNFFPNVEGYDWFEIWSMYKAGDFDTATKEAYVGGGDPDPTGIVPTSFRIGTTATPYFYLGTVKYRL